MTHWGNKGRSYLQLDAANPAGLQPSSKGPAQSPLGPRNLKQHVPQSQPSWTQPVTVEDEEQEQDLRND